jgi:hypothetical protein
VGHEIRSDDQKILACNSTAQKHILVPFLSVMIVALTLGKQLSQTALPNSSPKFLIDD